MSNSFEDFKKWIPGEYQTNVGATILHQSAQANLQELSLVLLHHHPDLVHSLDNFGRTPIFWCFYSGACSTALTLLSYGGHLNLLDSGKESPLHVAVREQKIEETKLILFWLLKHDTEYLHYTRQIYDCLQMKNLLGKTPIDLSVSLGISNFSSLLRVIWRICEEKLKSFGKSIFLEDVQMKSGTFNGKFLSKLDTTVVCSRIELPSDNSTVMNMYFYRRSKVSQDQAVKQQQQRTTSNNLGSNFASTMKVCLDLKTCAFVILERTHHRIEFTLTECPKVFLVQSSSSDIHCQEQLQECEKSIFQIDGGSGVSFHCFLNPLTESSKKDLCLLHQYLIESLSVVGILKEFQEYCFCYRPLSPLYSPHLKSQPILTSSDSSSSSISVSGGGVVDQGEQKGSNKMTRRLSSVRLRFSSQSLLLNKQQSQSLTTMGQQDFNKMDVEQQHPTNL